MKIPQVMISNKTGKAKMKSNPSIKGKRIALADPLIGEEEAKAAADVIKSGWIREGKLVHQFEQEFAKYVGVKHAIAVSSGTTALHVVLRCLNIKKGDEVVIPSFSCIPPLSMTLFAGGTPVLADIETKTYNLDPNSVEKIISKKTKLIVPINYAGHPAELDVLQEIANKNHAYLLNDTAEALGASYKGKSIAALGDISVFSFSPNKTITTGEGGMIATNNGELAEKARIIKDYGQKGRFHYVELGSNYRITEMQAAMGIVQLRKIDEILRRKRSNASLLTEKLRDIKNIQTPVELPRCTHVYCLYSIRLLSKKITRERLMAELDKAGVQTRVYFPPLHKSPLLGRFEFKKGTLHNTEEVASSILSLPSSPKLSLTDINYIGKVMRQSMI